MPLCLHSLKAKSIKSSINHHLFFSDLLLKLEGYGEVFPLFDIIIFDEAHSLESIAIEYFGYSISTDKINELINDTKFLLSRLNNNSLNELLDCVSKATNAFFTQYASLEDGDFPIIEKTYLEKHENSLKDLMMGLSTISQKAISLEQEDPEFVSIHRRADEISDALNFILNTSPDNYIRWLSKRKNFIVLRAAPIDVSEELKTYLFNGKNTIVLTSATLSTNGRMDFIRNSLGIEKGAKEIIIDAEYDYTSQVLFYLPPKMPDPNSFNFTIKASQEIKRIITTVKGRTFVLFTSYKNLNIIYGLIASELPYTTLKQGDAPRHQLIQAFKQDISSVLFATHSFWQGVDVEGEALSCVIIDRLPFAVPTDPIVQGKIQQIKERGGNPFIEFQLPAAVILLKQGFGRLIRSRNDKGIFSILDPRLKTKFYGKVFLNNLPPCKITSSLSDLHNFCR